MQDYFEEVYKALKDFHKYDKYNKQIKPLYMLIKVDVDADIVYDQCEADKYATNHCKSLEYELVDHYYPDEEQYPYIAKWRSLYAYWPL